MKNFFTLFLLTLSGSILAQTIQTDRPDQTESSSTIPSGALQIESGVLLQYYSENTIYNHHLLPTTLFRYGLWNFLELRLVSNIEKLRVGEYEKYGMNDFEAGFKVQLYKKENANTEVAFLSHFTFPTGTSFSASSTSGYHGRFLVSHPLGEYTSLGYNLGFTYVNNTEYNFIYSLALNRAVNEKVSVYIEPFGEITADGKIDASFDTGMAYLLRDNLQLDLSYGIGINHNMNYFSVGISWLTLKL